MTIYILKPEDEREPYKQIEDSEWEKAPELIYHKATPEHQRETARVYTERDYNSYLYYYAEDKSELPPPDEVTMPQ